MSRAAKRRETREGSSGSRPGRNLAPMWIMSGSVGAALLILALFARGGPADSHHPQPRVDAHASHVMPAARYERSSRVSETYAMAAQIPAVLDGIYCYCFCHNTFGHYSLLDCFLDDHAATCDVCMKEAVLAYEMTQRGDALDAIRQEVDRRYRT